MADVSVGRLVAILTLDGARFQQGLANARRDLQQTGSAFQSAGRRLTLGITVPLAAAAVGAIKAAADFEETRNKFNEVFRESAASAVEFSDKVSELNRRSSRTFQSLLADVQDLTTALGFETEEAAILSKAVSTLTVDMASFRNQQEPEVLRRFISALVGETEAARRLGADIRQTTLDQELMNRGIEGGIKSATEQEKVVARLAIVLRSNTRAMGDAARTSLSFTNRLRSLRDQIFDTAVEIGEKLIPVATRLIAFIGEQIQSFRNLDTRTQLLAISFAGLFATVGPLLVVLGLTFTALSKLRSPIRILLLGLPRLSAAIGLVSIQGLLIVSALTAAAVAIITFKDEIQRFLDSETVNAFTSKLGEIWDFITSGPPFSFSSPSEEDLLGRINRLSLSIVQATELMENSLNPEPIRRRVEKWTLLRNDLIEQLRAMREGVEGESGGIESVVESLADKFKTNFAEIAESAREVLGSALTAVTSKFDDFFETLQLGEGFSSSITDEMREAGDEIRAMLDDLLKGLDDLESGAKSTAEIIKVDFADPIRESIREMVTGLLRGTRETISAAEFFRNIMVGIFIEMFEQMILEKIKFEKEFETNIVDFVKTLGGQILDLLKKIFGSEGEQGLLSAGIRSLLGGIGSIFGAGGGGAAGEAAGGAGSGGIEARSGVMALAPQINIQNFGAAVRTRPSRVDTGGRVITDVIVGVTSRDVAVGGALSEAINSSGQLIRRG